jgi:glycosyltransferase involved in cell wall biosynthesis
MPSETIVGLRGGRRITGPARVHPPLVTVLVVVMHAEKELQDILQNLSEHNPDDFELLVMDGGSGQATLDLLNEWSDRIDLWVSEPDKGLYDAMNKGAALAQGDFIYHLNAGDRLVHLPVAELTAALDRKIDVVSFPVLVDGHRIFHPSCGMLLRFKNTLHHQGTFYRRTALMPYDLQYRFYSDFDGNQKLARRGVRMRVHKTVVAHHASGGIGDHPSAGAERFKIVGNNFGRPYVFGSWLLSEWGGIRYRNMNRLKRLLRLT